MWSVNAKNVVSCMCRNEPSITCVANALRGKMKFSERLMLSKQVDRYMKKNKIKDNKLGVICALEIMGYLNKKRKRENEKDKN